MARIRRGSSARRARVGDVIKGQYKILQVIGAGGMSRVYLASDLQLTNKMWAIKEVDRHATDPAGRPIEQSLAREADLLSKLNHPNIVDIVNIEKTDDFIYVVEDYVEGDTLADVVRKDGPQSEEDVQRWMLQACDALGYLHEQDPPIIYRDMKPNNIMLHPDGYIKLIDLGVAREYVDDVSKTDTVAFGTEGYAAPEQYGTKTQTDARTDIYELGATMWHLLSGGAPPMEFPLPDVRTVNPNVSEGFANIINKCCKLDRVERYQTCEELAVDLERYQELTAEFRQKQVRKVRSFALCAASAVLCVVVGLVCLGAREGVITQNFEYQMQIGDDAVRSSDAVAAQTAYLDAISRRPGDTRGYEGLIASYKIDGAFDTDEKAQFDSVYQANVEALRRSDDFAQLSFDIGQLYWYCYAYGGAGDAEENQSTRIKASAEYFQAAAEDVTFEDRQRAQVYSGIAEFNLQISEAVRTDSDSDEDYQEYWDNLEQLADTIDGDTNNRVRLDSYALIVNALETYLYGFEGAGITQSEVEDLYTVALQGLNDLEGRFNEDDAGSEAERQDALSRLQNQVRTKITTVYAGAVVGGN